MATVRRKKRIPTKTLQQVAPVLRILAHPHRLRIVEILLSEPVSVRKLASMLKLTPPVVSQHLGQMRSNGIVTPRREGKQVYYRVVNPNAANLIQCIQANGPGR
ncbi:MAG: metalloregulator ArsR/SmtB family transcription factor [Phycisphaerae bacterium]|jgi:DNA-binding transcriptional ArsR family regulator